MRRTWVVFLLAVICGISTSYAQSQDTTALKTDSSNIEALKDEITDNIATVNLDDNDIDDGSSQSISSALMGGRDPFFSAAAFNFSAQRFRIRGYDGDASGVYLNGAPMENLDNGFSPFNLWGGLNTATRFKDLSIGLRPNLFSFGELSSVTAIDARPSKQRRQFQVDYAFSNRSFTHKTGISYSTGVTKKGWAFMFSGSRRYAEKGYVPGTSYNGWSYFAGVDKHFGTRHTLSLVAFAAPTKNGRAAATTREAKELTGDNYYNPYWGYQNGKVRNGYISKNNQPVFILTHDFKISKAASLQTAVTYSTGERSSSFIDRYNASDPRPDYYRYMPSYQQGSYFADQITAKWQANDPAVTQIDWDALYMGNRNTETFNGTTGKRSYYWIGDYVTKTQRINFNTVLNARTGKHSNFTGGLTYQYQKNNFFQRAEDLLGGDYFINWNQFAERDFPANTAAKQYDLRNPDRIVKQGDHYGYDYDVTFSKSTAWAQMMYKYSKVDFFFAAQATNNSFYRFGNTTYGVVPNDSYGKSAVQNFFNYAVKGGLTYKMKEHSVYVNAAVLTKAPYYDNIYRSIRTRNTLLDNVSNENIRSAEAGYVYYGPNIKVRLTGYYTDIKNQMDVKVFYDESYGTLVSYAITGINKQHFGGEMGFEARLARGLTLHGAAAVGRYYYDSRQHVTITADNTPSLNRPTTVYSQNYRLGGSPQEAYNLGLQYRSPNFWSVNLTGNYFRKMWIDINPVRHTAEFVDGVAYKSDLWNAILKQEELPEQFTLDFYGSWSYKMPARLSGKRRTFLVFSAGVNNILDNKDLVIGGFEQLRVDYGEKNINKFPSKYTNGFGRNYFVSLAIRRN